MRPYLAVLKDSFREAFASRILWMLTGLITLVLFIGLAPFTLREESAARFQRNEFRNGPEFLKLLASQANAHEPTAAVRIWSRLPESLRHRLQAVSPDNVNEQVEVLWAVRRELNGMLGRDDLYDPAAWAQLSLSGEACRLVGRGVPNLSVEEKQRLNRLLIDAAFPGFVLPAPGRVLHAHWFGYRLGAPLPFEPKQLGLLVKFALAALTNFLAGILGIFIAVLVTAPTVPQTFEPGAIDLLLSKPVSRSLLFLTKFFGATVFVLLNSAYLIGGMWLIAGLRFDIWSGKLLLCIPVFMFLFVIYYSVSALTGVIWRNAIVSVCCTILFWGLCYVVGIGKSVAEDTFLDSTRLAAIIPAGEKLLATNRAGQTFEWSSGRKIWEEVFRGREDTGPTFFFHRSLLGPVYDSHADRICALELTPTRFEFFGGVGKLFVGPRSEDWRRLDVAVTPSGPQSLFIDSKGRIVVVSLTGVFRFEGNVVHEHRPFKLLGVDLAPHDRSSKFLRVGPLPEPTWQRPFTAAMNPSDGTLAIFSHGKLIVLALDASDKYAVKRELDLATEKGAVIAIAGTRIVVAHADGRVQIFSGDSLLEEIALNPRGRTRPRKVASSSDGRWLAILFDDRTIWLYDLARQAPVSGRVGGQGDISAIAFSPVNQLLVSDGFGRVIAYEIEPFQRVETFEPPAETLDLLYRYLVMPLYTVLPKPGELDGLVTHLVVGDPIELFDQELRAREEQNREQRSPVDVWHPIWSNLIFLAAMLTVTCVYISRRDF